MSALTLSHIYNKLGSCTKTIYMKTIFFFLFFRDFRLVLREDANSVFSPDIQIENSLGPLDYDISRVYSGVVEGKLILFFIFLVLSTLLLEQIDDE